MEKTSRRRKIVTIIIILNIVFAIGLVAAYFYSREEISDSEASPNEQVKQGFPGFQPKNLLKEEPRDEDSFFRSLRQSVDIGIEDEKVSQYIPGDIIVVFKDAESTIRVSSERSSSINLDADILPFEYLDKQTLPKELKDIDSKYTVKTIEKVFKGKGSPENELRNLQDRFREEIAQGEKMIDETGILSQNLSNHYMIKISDTDSTIEARSELEKSPEVLSADLNYIHSVNYTPNDPLYPLQWAHQNSKASQAWDTTLGSSNVKIAIIDTGVDYDHEDLEGSMITDCTNGCPTGTGYDFVNIDIALWQSWGYSLISGEDYTTQDNKPTDFFGHGTHCAGIAAAKGNNSKGVSGLCPNCKIMPVRVGFSINLGTNTFGVMDTLSIIEGITYAADQGADIISMSFGGSPKTTADQVAIQYAKNLGVVLIGAAGNSGQENPIASYPGAYEEVLAVSSTNNLNKMSYFSNYGYWVEVGAPGENILSTVPKTGTLSDPSGYMSLSGTSMAAPYVAGLAGLVLSQNPSWEPAKVEEALTTGVFNPITLTTYFGSGIVDSPLTLSINSFVSSPVVITSPENDNIVDGNINIVGTAQGTSYTVSVGTGLYPTSWTNIGLGTSVSNNTLATWDTSQVPSNLYTIKLTVTQNTKVKSTFKRINLSKGIRTNWPISFYDYTPFNPTTFSHAVVDLNNDQIKEIILGRVNEKKVFDLNGNKIDGWPVVDYTTGSLGFMQLLLLTIGKTDGSSYEILFPRHDMILDPYNPEDISYCFNNHYFNGSKKPGWPVRCDKTIDESQLVRDFSWLDLTGISLHDINNDGKNEVIGVSVDDPPSLTESNNDIFVLNGDGTNFPGWPVQLPIGYLKVSYGPIAVANVDNDSGKELVLWAINPNNQTFLFIFETNGTLKSGYPKTLFNSLTIGGPILVDIDNDGALEFPVFSDRGKCDTNGGQIRYMNLDGTTVPGWPKNFEQEAFLFAPTIGDIDRDGSVETIFGTSGINGTNGLCLTDNYKVYAFKSNGTLMPGWPVTVKGQILSQATIGDVNGDFSPDVLVSTLEGFVYAIDKSGQILNGFPRIMDDPSDSGIEIGDFDNDQKVEILGSTSYTKAFLWDLNVPYNPQTMLWPVFMKDSARTGVYLGTPTPQPTNTMTPTPSRTPTPQLTNSVTPTPSRTPTPQLTNSVTPTPSRTPTPQLTNSVTPTPSRTPTPIPSWTPNPSISVTPTKTPVPVTITPTTSTSTGAILCGRADIDSDNKFNILDFSDFAIKYNKSCNDSPAQYTSYEPCKGKDYDRNSRIDILDFASFASRYMKASCAIN